MIFKRNVACTLFLKSKVNSIKIENYKKSLKSAKSSHSELTTVNTSKHDSKSLSVQKQNNGPIRDA